MSKVADQFGSAVPFLDGFFNKWDTLGEVCLKSVPNLPRRLFDIDWSEIDLGL